MTEVEIQYGKGTVEFTKDAPPKLVHLTDDELSLVTDALGLSAWKLQRLIQENKEALSLKSKIEMAEKADRMKHLKIKIQAL